MTLAPSTKTPQVSGSIVFGGSGASPSSAAKRVLIIGAMVATAITTTVNTSGSTTSTVTTDAGTAALDRATLTTSPDNAAALAGRGSELHLGAIAAFEQDRTASIYLAPVTYGATPVAASAVITPTLGTLTAGTLRVIVCGRSVDVTISASDTVSTIGLKIAQAINAQRDWPVVATNVWLTGAVTVTAKCAGLRGNAISVRCQLVSTVQTLDVYNATAVTLFGLTITLSGGAVDGGAYRLANGSVDDNVTDLLAALSSQKFDRIVFAGYRVGGSASANLARIATAVDTQGGAAQMFDQQVVFGSIESAGNVVALSQGLNRERCSFAWSFGADDLPIEIAAVVAVGRLAGDSVGGSLIGESTDPSANLNGLELARLRTPRDPADLADPTEIETALNAGVSPLAASGVRVGRMQLVASITSRSLNGSTPDFSVYKTKDVTVPDWVRAEVVADLRTTYRGFRLVADPANGQPSQVPRVTSPRTVKERIYGLLKRYETRGILTEVDARRSDITVSINATNPRRLDFSFPTVPTQDFDIADGTIHQLQPSS